MSVPMEATPFFGSKISLISKSEIRYEGILYTIDPKESTIALAQVRSFGSEDRIVDKPVPPRDEIYQYIIFRATDIKDLIVDDPPPTPALTDPAIITAHSTSTTFPSSFPQSSISTGSTSAPQPPPQQAPSGSQVQQQLQTSSSHRQKHDVDANKPKASTSGGTSSGPSASTSAAAAAKSANIMSNLMGGNKPQQSGQQQPPQRQQQQGSQQHMNQQQQNRSQGQGQHQQHHQGQMSQNRTQGGGGQGGGFQRRPPPNQQQQQGTQPFQQRNGHQPNFRQNQHQHQHQGGYQQQNRNFGHPPMMRGHPMGGFRRGSNLRNNYQPRPMQKTVFNPIPDSDFDFEKAANEFKVLEEKMASLKVTNGEGGDVDESSDSGAAPENEDGKEICYNKTKSFFDTISCESIEREKGNNQRVDWKAERKLNRETFGVVNLYRRPPFARGRGGFIGGYRNYHHGYRPRGHAPNRGPPQQNGGTPKPMPKSNGVSSSTASPATPSTSAAVVAASPAK